MRFEEACEAVFARHETFYPRYGWVKKAVDAASANSDLFNDEMAVVELGVGKNMVRSIRHWGLAYKMLAQEKEEGRRTPAIIDSTLGRAVFYDAGLDPYAESPATPWLLHWWLLAPPSLAPVWWLTFNEFPGVEFNEAQLTQFLLERCKDWNPLPAAIQKDVSCLLRMYAAGGAARMGFDDSIDCPSRELGLILPTSERGVFRFSIGEKPTLPALVVAYACLDFLARVEGEAKTVMVSRLATESGGPGRAFKITEPNLLNLLEIAETQIKEIHLSMSAGAPQLSIDGNIAEIGSRVLVQCLSQEGKVDSLDRVLCGRGSDRGAKSQVGAA